MTKSQRMKSEDRKKSILEAAIPLFAQKGFVLTTTKDISIAAGVSEALLYKHYPSKESIYKDLHDICCLETEVSAEKIAELKPSTSTLVAAVYLVASSIVRGVPGDPAMKPILSSLCAHSIAENSGFATSLIKARLEPWIYKFEECFEASIEAGDVVAWNSNTRRIVLFAHHISAMISFFSIHGNGALDYQTDDTKLVEEVTHFTLRGMGVKEEAIQKYFNPSALAMFF